MGDARESLRDQGNVRARHIVARYLHSSTVVVQSRHGIIVSRWTCRALARDAGKASSYQSPREVCHYSANFNGIIDSATVDTNIDLGITDFQSDLFI